MIQLTPEIVQSFLENEKNIKKEDNFIINSDKNNIFSVNIQNLSNYIKVIASQNNDISKEKYEKKLYINELKSNKFLSLCDSIDEIYEQLIIELKKENNKNIIEENNKINLIIPIEHIKIKEIKFILEKK